MHNAQLRTGVGRRTVEQNQLIQRNLASSPNGAGANGSSVTGDVARESYRLSTFLRFPQAFHVDMCLVASHGFYYNNSGTTIKCFSCGETAEISPTCDDRWLRRIHKHNCSFANGRDTRNTPIQQFSPYESETHSSNFNDRGSLDQSPHHASNLRETISIQPSSSASSVHRNRAATSTTSSTQSNSRNVNIQQIMDHADILSNNVEGLVNSIASQRQQEQQQPEIDLLVIFPCLFPVNPHMRDYRARLQTFLDKRDLWNRSALVTAAPQQLAKMGMYYLGERDRTKCWYCNGGLQNWKRDDDPWEEHAKWFPTCEFVLQKKGPEYVHRIVARFPNLRRPVMVNQPSTSSQNRGAEQVQPNVSFRNSVSYVVPRPTIGFGANTPRYSRQESAGPVLVDPQAENRERKRKIEDAWSSSGLVHQARSMGFQENLIKLALKKQFELHDRNFSNVEDFVDGILSVSASDIMMDDEESSAEESSSTSRSTLNGNSSPLSSQSSFQAIQNLTQAKICKRCRVNPACMVFLPCGHFVCCYECRNDWDRCPICHSFIREKIRSYLS